MGFIHGAHRHEESLCPERLDDYMAAENPVRCLAAFVDHLHLTILGFQRATPAATGRPAYHPAALVKRYIYGYRYRFRSSRRLAQATHRPMELMWLLKKLRPDHKTLADFRKNNLGPLRPVWRECTLRQAKAVLGSTFEAVAEVGDAHGEEVKTCLEAGITPYVARPLTSAHQQLGLFSKEDCTYEGATDTSQCPAGARLTFRVATVALGRPIRY
jgi:transposase